MIEELLEFYDKNKRDIPWRKNRDPYSIWISEIMCQQTRVDTVIPYYERFMASFPSIQDLADADDDLLMKHWQGLGYYNRARNLKKAAVIICREHGGKFPDDYDSILTLPGIGEYTACAILSMAWDKPYASVDGNFQRVFSRLWEDDSDIALNTSRTALRERLEEGMPARSGDFNQAVMDLGATICLPNEEPRCDQCPLKEECLAHLHGTETEYPVSSKKTKVTEHDYTLFLIRKNGMVVLRKRKENGLLGGLYEFPNVKGHLTEKQVCKRFSTKEVRKGSENKHHFSHQTWHMLPYIIDVEEYIPQKDEFFASMDEIEHVYSIPKAFNQFLFELDFLVS